MISLSNALPLVLLPSAIVAQTLPVFSVKNSFQGASRAHELIKNLYNNAGTPTYTNSRLIVQAPDNSSIVEIDTLSGGIWTADNTRLWNTSHAQHLGVFEKGKHGCKNAAENLIKQHGLLPAVEKGSPITFEFAGTSGTYLSKEDGHAEGNSFKREEFQLDTSVNYRAQVTLPGRDQIPVVGGGGKFQFTFEENSRLIGHHGVWRDVQGSGVDYSVIPQEDSDAQFSNATKSLSILSFNSTLAYYSAPFGQVQSFLYPVYVYHATAKFDNHTVELRETILPASTFGTELPGLSLKPDCAAPKEKKTKSNDTATVKTPKAPKSHSPKSPGKANRTRRAHRRGLDDSTWEFGTEWLGQPWGLSQTNAAGIRNLLFNFVLFPFSLITWTNRFDWGDNLVWESDWNRNDDVWVDTVDLMFYTGHANGDGWVTAAPDSTFVDHSIVGANPENPGDLWGQLDLEWLVVAACGPHQDDRIVAGGGNAFDRWRGVFDGLHLFLGYATVTADTAGEGSRLVQYAKGGATLKDSWFRTAKETQGGDVWVTAMWSGESGNDHLPGHGSMAKDQDAGAQRWLMWSKC